MTPLLWKAVSFVSSVCASDFLFSTYFPFIFCLPPPCNLAFCSAVLLFPPQVKWQNALGQRFNNYFPLRIIKTKSLCHFQFCVGLDGRVGKCDLTSPLCSPSPCLSPRKMQALALFSSDGGSKMKGRVIYKCIKNECIYEVLFSSHSLLAIVVSLYPSFCAYKALQNSLKIVFIPFEHRGAANAGSKQTVCLISTVSSCFLSCDRWWSGQQCGFAEHRGWRWPG